MDEEKKSIAKKVGVGLAVLVGGFLAFKGCEAAYKYVQERREQAAIQLEEKNLEMSKEYLKGVAAEKAYDVKQEYKAAFDKIRKSGKDLQEHARTSALITEVEKRIEDYIDDIDCKEDEKEAISNNYLKQKGANLTKIAGYAQKIEAFKTSAEKACAGNADCSGVMESYIKDDKKRAEFIGAIEALAQAYEVIAKDCQADSKYLGTALKECPKKPDDIRGEKLDQALKNYGHGADEREEMARHNSEKLKTALGYMKTEVALK